jgi:NDP-sugar pyrophosphorylase family protein
MAGGKGTRLAPYTHILPKPLMPIEDMPILEIVLRQLRLHGFGHITICVGHLAELLMAFFGDGRKLGLDIQYAIEDRPLDTIGPLRLVDLPQQPFLVMNGDILTDMNYSAMYAYHVEHEQLLTVATYRKPVDITLGVLEYGADRLVHSFREKPRLIFDVSMGIYLMDPKIIDLVPAGRPYGFDKLVLDLLAKGNPPKVYPFEGLWLDIGRPEDYTSAGECFVRNRHRFLPSEEGAAE